MVPEYMQENFVSKYSIYDLRTTDVLALPKPTTNNGKRTFSYRGATLYNDIPLSVRQAICPNDFYRKVNDLPFEILFNAT